MRGLRPRAPGLPAEVCARRFRGPGLLRYGEICSSRPAVLSAIGLPWTESEHRLFLLGLSKLGRVRTPFIALYIALYKDTVRHAGFLVLAAASARKQISRAA